MMNLLKAFWLRFSTPSKAAMGLILFMGFAGGLGFWGAFNHSMEVTNTEQFCLDCHPPLAYEIQETVHFSNRTGFHVTCADCHVPHNTFAEKMTRKLQASKEIYAHYVTGTIDTPEKFEERRRYLAEKEWQRMKNNDSQECRACHNVEYMDMSEQASISAEQHKAFLATGEKTCIDCHKGIAHQLPNMHGVEGWQ